MLYNFRRLGACRLEAVLGYRGRRADALEAQLDVAREVVGRNSTVGGGARHTERRGRSGGGLRRSLLYYQLHLTEIRARRHHRLTHVTQQGTRRGHRGNIGKPGDSHGRARRRPGGGVSHRGAKHLVDHRRRRDEIRRVI